MKKIVIITVFCLGLKSCFAPNDDYVEFRPVYFNLKLDKYIENDSIPENFYNNLEEVLNHYSKKYKKREGVIYIERKLYQDKDLCWNYTTKSQDTIWLKTKGVNYLETDD